MFARLIAFLLHLLPSVHVGTATRFSAVGDHWNPRPYASCLRRDMDDERDAVIAHRSLPCLADVLVCLPRTRRCTWARVGDRGPRVAMLDLSPLVSQRLEHDGKEPTILIVWEK